MKNKVSIVGDDCLWEAWVENQKENQKTLFVVGEIPVIFDGLFPSLIKDQEQSIKDLLVLQVSPNLYFEDGPIVEVVYSEEFQEQQQYKSIVIVAGGVNVTLVEDIENLVI